MALASPSGRLFTSGAAKPGEESSKIQIVNAAPDKRAFLGSLGVEAKSDEIPAYPVLTRLVIGSETLKRGRTFCLPLAGLCAIILEKVGDMAASGKKPFSNFFPDSERDYPGPLANPVLHEICGDTNGIKFGFESLINAVLADSGDQPIAKVTKVKPQQVQSGKGERTYRVDVAVSTKDNEIIVVEAQLYKFADMDARAMLYIQEYLDIGSKKGESLEDVIKKIPRIIFVGLLDFVFRQS